MPNSGEHYPEAGLKNPKNAYAATPTKLGPLLEISLSGLTFSSVDRGTWPGESFTLEIVAGEKEFYLGNINAHLVQDDTQDLTYRPDNQPAEHIYRVKFERLSKKQSFQLQYFLLSFAN